MQKIAFVTGGSRGIGAAIVEGLIEQCDLVIATYNKSKPEIINDKVSYIRLDITCQESCKRVFDKLQKDCNFPNILVNNAGITNDAFFHKMDKDSWSEVINTNLISIFNVTNEIYKKMRDNGYGRIVNISSINANKGQVGQTNYCASKAGIQGFTRALALESASKNITVNSISPGYCSTDMVNKIPTDIKENIIKSIPVNRLGAPEEIAELVRFLISDNAGFITGANIEINGGQYLS
jgi:acetoacetyl-CoA reductase